MTHAISLQNTRHVALVGDSVFDSRPYLRGQPHMAERITRADQSGATLLAVSGSRLADIRRQLERMPGQASHIVASVGGNDVIDLGAELRSGGLARGLSALTAAFDRFRERHAAVCAQIAALEKPAALCTIYQPPINDAALRDLSTAVLGMVNDAIRLNAERHDLDLIDLRPICRDPEDFFDPIHPSSVGADKIAAAIAAWLRGAETGGRRR